MQDEPKITVGITTYNRPTFLREAVSSVLRQSYQNFEIIVSNDCLEAPVDSKNLSLESDSRLIIINQAQNLGELSNMNFLLSIATGKYFTWLADDDLLHPNFFAEAIKSFATFKELNCVGFYSNFSSEISSFNAPSISDNSTEIIALDQGEFIDRYAARKIPLIGCYGVIRTDALREVNGISRLGKSFGPYSDTFIPFKLSFLGPLAYSTKTLVFLRTHDNSISSTSIDLAAYIEAQLDFVAKMVAMFGGSSLKLKNQRVAQNLMQWFCNDSWAVIWRNQDLSILNQLTCFFESQISQSTKFLTPLRSLRHAHYTLYVLIRNYLLLAYKSFRRGGANGNLKIGY